MAFPWDPERKQKTFQEVITRAEVREEQKTELDIPVDPQLGHGRTHTEATGLLYCLGYPGLALITGLCLRSFPSPKYVESQMWICTWDNSYPCLWYTVNNYNWLGHLVHHFAAVSRLRTLEVWQSKKSISQVWGLLTPRLSKQSRSNLIKMSLHNKQLNEAIKARTALGLLPPSLQKYKEWMNSWRLPLILWPWSLWIPQ